MRSALWGRRVHIAGSVSKSVADAPAAEVDRARVFIQSLVPQLVRAGATFVLPVDAEPLREDRKPICFDWLVWRALADNISARPAQAPLPYVVAVKHNKNEDQVPVEFASIWDQLRTSDLVDIRSTVHWNMAAKRLETQARVGDILLAIGGDEGVQFLANLYHEAGKPVVPLNFKIGVPGRGAAKLFEIGQLDTSAPRLFRTESAPAPHVWINRLESSARKSNEELLREVMALLNALARPNAFAVRLLDDSQPDFNDVQTFFDVVVKQVLEDDLGYRLTTIDSKHEHEEAFVDKEIFVKLHRAQLVIADITGLRPNCFLELGYAFGRELRTILTARRGTKHPFDVSAFGGFHWETKGATDERRRAFRDHLSAMRSRRPMVPNDPLIP